MLNLIELNKILNLLNLNITVEDGKYYITNYTSNTVEIIFKKENYFEYSFLLNEVPYLIKFNKDEIIIIRNQEEIIFNHEGFNYHEIDKQPFNKSRVTIYSSQLSFYSIEENNSISIKATNAKDKFIFAKIAEETRNNDIQKKDTIFQKGEQYNLRIINNRIYANTGQLVSTSNQVDGIQYILDEIIAISISKYDIPQELMNRIEDMLPGITEYLQEMNPNLKRILKQEKELKKR